MYFTRRLAKGLKVSSDHEGWCHRRSSDDLKEYMDGEITNWYDSMNAMKHSLSFDSDRLMGLHPALFWEYKEEMMDIMRFYATRADVYKVDWIYNKIMAGPNVIKKIE